MNLNDRHLSRLWAAATAATALSVPVILRVADVMATPTLDDGGGARAHRMLPRRLKVHDPMGSAKSGHQSRPDQWFWYWPDLRSQRA